MAKYYRRGHYRRGKNGKRVWVSGHSVRRSNFVRHSRGYPRSSNFSFSQKSVARRPGFLVRSMSPELYDLFKSYESRIPNAKCPFCDASLWFIRTQNGERLYLEIIGSPWTTHPCLHREMTDRQAITLSEVESAYQQYISGVKPSETSMLIEQNRAPGTGYRVGGISWIGIVVYILMFFMLAACIDLYYR